MPKIPQADNQANINVGAAPRISTPEMGLGAAAKSAQAQNEVTQAIAQAEDVLIKVRDFRQQTEANNYAFERLNEIKSRADQDNNFDATPYETEIDKVGTEAAKTITGRLSKDEFMASFQKQAISTKWGIKNDFRAKELKSIDASIDYQGQQIIDNYGGMNDAERITNVANYRKSLENGVKVGLYNKATAEAKYAVFQNKVVEGKVEFDILSNPSYALGELQQGKEGEYAALPDNKRVDFIKQAETRIEKIKNQQEEAVAIAINQKEADLIDLKIAGNLTEQQVKQEREQGGISAKFADSMIRALRNPKKAVTKDSVFKDMVEDILNPSKKPEDIRLKLMQKNGSTELSDEDFNILNTFNKSVTTDVIDKALPKQKHLWGLLQWGIDAKLRPEVKTRMMKSYMQRISQGEDSAVAMKEVIRKETLNIHPQAVNYPEKGKKIIDLTGVIKKILPIGDIEDDTGDAD